jgi:isocitrate dehydrogenase
MSTKIPITVAHGDGIGPEIMDASLHIIQAAGADLDIETIEIGEKVYLSGNSAGIAPSAWESLRRTKVFFKAPITTPQGGGFKSLNVTTRKRLGLYANVRPCVSYSPFVRTKHPGMDVVIVRENEEDLYAGIEYRLSPQVYECLKIITVPGCEKIVRFAFEYAVRNNRKKVTCFTKDNIMKMTDGLFHKVFDEIAGSVGLAGSANIGTSCAMFEAIHGSAPRRAGQNLANPSGLLLGGVMMLVHIGQPEIAGRVHNAWLRTMEDGVHTYDIFKEGVSKEKVGTKEFAEAVVARLGQKPETLKPIHYGAAAEPPKPWVASTTPIVIELYGADLYIDTAGQPIKEFGDGLAKVTHEGLSLLLISSRGVVVWPEAFEETFVVDVLRCRFVSKTPVTGQQIVGLMQKAVDAGYDITKHQSLRNFDGKTGYTMAQGQ